jgi:uncharacterized protein YggU (UPF0235/DUF167 family)
MEDRAVSVRLDVVARPGARRPAVTLRPDGTLVVSVTAPPEQGKANAALVRAIAEALDVPPSSVTLVRGARGRQKVVEVPLGSHDEVRRRLTARAGGADEPQEG